jgi:hypothetical protein
VVVGAASDGNRERLPLNIIPLNDPSAANNQSFLADEKTAISIYQSWFPFDNITVTINFSYGYFDGQQLDPNLSAGDVNQAGVHFLSYAELRNDLLKADPFFFTKMTTLPVAISAPNGGTFSPGFWVSPAVGKIFGLAPITAVDGDVGIGTGFASGSERVAALLHEIGHALGRDPENFTGPNNQTYYSELDLWRFTGVGTRLFDGNNTTPTAAYFSLDNGVTDRADWGQTFDDSDFRGPDSTPASNLTPNDPFNEGVNGNSADLTGVDGLVMDALGFDDAIPAVPIPPILAHLVPIPPIPAQLEPAAGRGLAAGPLLAAAGLSAGPIGNDGQPDTGGGARFVPKAAAQAINQQIEASHGALDELKDSSTSFAGTVAGLLGRHPTGFADTGFPASSQLGYNGNGCNLGATPSQGDAMESNLALLGSYMASVFAAAGDGHGATLIGEAMHNTNQTPLVSPPQ